MREDFMQLKRVLKLRVSPEAQRMIDELSGLADQRLLEKFFQPADGSIELGDFVDELLAVDVDSDAAFADDVIISLEPTDRFRMLMAALAAGDVDSFFVKNAHG
jgi:hypothetical protein